MENIYRNVGGYDMSYDEFKQLWRETLKKQNKYLRFDRSKMRDQVRYCIWNESKNTYIESTPETKAF